MKYLLAVLAFAPLAAQAEDAPAGPVRLANRSALMFDLNGLLAATPSALDGVGVGGRFFIDRKTAIRAAVGFNLLTTEAEQKVNSETNKREDSTSSYSVEGAIEWVLRRSKSAYLYGGPLLQLGYSSTEPDANDRDSTATNATLAGVIGATYFVADGLSLGAEYRIGLHYTSTEAEQGESVDATTTNSLIGVGAVGFHLGFWF